MTPSTCPSASEECRRALESHERKSFAPLLVSVYTRLQYLRQCIDSLLANRESIDTDLYVVSDAANSAADSEKVRLVREFVSRIDGFRSVTLMARERNLGSFESVTSAIDSVLAKHGRVIFLEDDNVVSRNFLRFLNDCLDFYKDDPSIFAVCGYNYPVRMPKLYHFDVYKWQGFSAWGVGLWREKWMKISWGYEGLEEILADKSKVRTINSVAGHYLPRFVRRRDLGEQIGDSIISYNILLRNQYSIFPVVSKVRNIGHDGTGEHCGFSDIYVKQALDTGGDYTLVKGIGTDERVNRVLRKHFRIARMTKFKRALSRVLPARAMSALRRLRKQILMNHQE